MWSMQCSGDRWELHSSIAREFQPAQAITTRGGEALHHAVARPCVAQAVAAEGLAARMVALQARSRALLARGEPLGWQNTSELRRGSSRSACAASTSHKRGTSRALPDLGGP